jgi:hypothetical protein
MTRAFGRALLVLAGLPAAAACARPDVEIRALPDGTRELTCKHTLPQCLSHVEDVCKGSSYEVLYATDTQKVYGSPSANEVESRTSQAVVHCLGPHQKSMADAAAPAGVVGGPLPNASASAASPVAPAVVPPAAVVASARACVPGATQACVGPGACSGGQSCLHDGSGFGACDCGGSKPAP